MKKLFVLLTFLLSFLFVSCSNDVPTEPVNKDKSTELDKTSLGDPFYFTRVYANYYQSSWEYPIGTAPAGATGIAVHHVGYITTLPYPEWYVGEMVTLTRGQTYIFYQDSWWNKLSPPNPFENGWTYWPMQAGDQIWVHWTFQWSGEPTHCEGYIEIWCYWTYD